MWIIKKISQQIYRLFDTDGALVSEFNTFGNAKDYAIRAGYATIFDL